MNCSFIGNSAPETGGGIYSENSDAGLTNCSFLGNSSGYGGGITVRNSRYTLTNCVLFGNGGGNTFYYEGYIANSSITIKYSLLEAGVTNFTDGGNNLTTCVSPFVSPTDARLNGCSPAINTGDNAANATATDLAGNARVFPNGGRIDMGAYEYQGTPGQTPTVAIPGVSTATVGVAFSQNFTAAGGSGPYSYSVASGSLPTGLGLATTGVLSGTPTQSGSFTITVLGRDATGCSGVSAAYVLTVINATPTITGFAANPAALCVGSPVTFMATIGNLMGSYSYTLTNGSLTQTGNSTSTTFSQSVTASGSGTQTFTLTASVNGQSAASVTALTVNPLPPAPTLTGVSRTVNANNTPLPLGQFVSAPGTLSFSGVSGAIANPPTANISTGGVQNFQVTQTDANGCISGATPFSITVLPPTPGNQTVCRSSLVVLTALTTGVRYEWYKNGQSTPFKLTEIASIQRGTATSSLTLVSVQTTASYYCKVFQANGSFTFDGPLKVTVDYSCIAPGARLGAHAVAATEGAEVPLSITLTPNPVVDGQLKAVVRGVAGAALSVDLLDLNGQVVRSQHWASAAGEQVIEWNIAAQPAGQYLLQAQAAGQRSTAKVIHR